MRTVLGLTFLLGLISLIVPLKFLGISTRRRGALVMVASFGLVAIYGLIFDSSNNASRSSTSTANVSPATATASPASATPSKSNEVPAIESKWRDSGQKDKMRNRTTQYATLNSDKELSFYFPYNRGSTGELTLLVSPKYGKDVHLQMG